jgi:hypothetical protein
MKVIYKIKQLLSNFILRIGTLLGRTPDRVRNNVPYVSQFATPGWAEMVIKDDQPIARDLLWEESGARTIKEYERWVLVTCGMACTSMVLTFYNKGDFRTIPLARDAAKSRVYLKDGDGISNMQYQPYTKWLKRFDLRATIYTKLTYKSMCYLLSKGILVIASVNPNINDYETAPKTQMGGHLVLITGYNKKEKTITFHNPSGFETNETQQNHTLKLKVFSIFFAGRGIAIKNVS